MTPLYGYKIAAGYGNTAGLVNVESIIPTGGTAFFAPVAYSAYKAGVRKVRSDGTLDTVGFVSCSWVFPAMTRKQWEYLQDTYCGGAGGFSGKVTICTRTGGRAAYANFNAILTLPEPELLTRRFTAFEDVVIQFTRMVAL